MQIEIFKTMNEMTQQALENWKKIGEMNLKIAARLFDAQVELTTTLVDVVSMNGEEISHTKDVKEIVSLQAEVIQQSSKCILEGAHSVAGIMADAGKVYSHVFESSLKESSKIINPTNISNSKKTAA